MILPFGTSAHRSGQKRHRKKSCSELVKAKDPLILLPAKVLKHVLKTLVAFERDNKQIA